MFLIRSNMCVRKWTGHPHGIRSYSSTSAKAAATSGSHWCLRVHCASTIEYICSGSFKFIGSLLLGIMGGGFRFNRMFGNAWTAAPNASFQVSANQEMRCTCLVQPSHLRQSRLRGLYQYTMHTHTHILKRLQVMLLIAPLDKDHTELAAFPLHMYQTWINCICSIENVLPARSDRAIRDLPFFPSSPYLDAVIVCKPHEDSEN